MAARGEQIWISVVAVGIVLLGFVAAYQFVAPAPPRHLVLAAGPEDGAYWRFAQRYRAALARSGIDLEVRATAGSIENLALLEDEASGVAVAFVQGGRLGTLRTKASPGWAPCSSSRSGFSRRSIHRPTAWTACAA